MIKVRIHGIKDGLHDIAEDAPVSSIKDMSPEFIGDIHFEGKLRKLGKRFAITGFAECKAKLICDLSLEEYEDVISTEISVSFIADTVLFNLNGKEQEADPKAERVVHEDDEYFDLSSDVKEQLIVELPMKRVSPAFRDKSFEELHPELAGESKPIENESIDEPVDSRWSALKNLKLN